MMESHSRRAKPLKTIGVAFFCLWSTGFQLAWAGALLPRYDISAVDKPLTTIRVRVFPHKRGFAPHQKDLVRSWFVLKSEKPFLVYSVKSREHLELKVPLIKTRELLVSYRRLKTALWVESPSKTPIKLERPQGQPSWEYLGSLFIDRRIDRITKKPYLLAVNWVDLEQYLKGVVPSEVFPNWPLDTLKAQAVAARTYAVFHILAAMEQAQSHPDWDVDDTVVFQAYTGVSYLSARASQAVEETKGQIVLQKQQYVLPTFYHADSGGVLASSERVFSLAASFYQTRKEPFFGSKLHKQNHWSIRLTADSLTQKLITGGVIPQQSHVVDIQIRNNAKAPSGRVEELDIYLENGSIKTVSVERWKRVIDMPSALFEVIERPVKQTQKIQHQGHFVFRGRGSGHGVGLSQTGAKILAQEYGWTYQQILYFYYQGADLCQLNPHQVDQDDNRFDQVESVINHCYEPVDPAQQS